MARGSKIKNWFTSVTVEPILFFYMLGIFLLFSVFQNMLYNKVCLQYNNATVCSDLYQPEHKTQLDQVQREASWWVKVSTACMIVPSILVDCYLGSWSDIFGRKPVLMLPPTGGFLGNLVYISLVSFSDMEVQWILLASCLQGIFGSFTSLLTGVLAYIGTVTSQQERTSRMSLLMAMSFVAGTAGPFLSGLLASKVSHLFVFISISVCHATAILYTMFFVKEIKTERDNEKKKITLARIVSLDHLVSSMQTCFFQREQEEKKKIAILFTMAFFVMTITAGELDIAFLYMKDTPLKVPFQTFSFWFGARYGLSSLALLIILPLLKKLNLSDAFVCMIGLISKMAGLIVLGLIRSKEMIFLEVAVSVFSQFALTSIRSLISQCVSDGEQDVWTPCMIIMTIYSAVAWWVNRMPGNLLKKAKRATVVNSC